MRSGKIALSLLAVSLLQLGLLVEPTGGPVAWAAKKRKPKAVASPLPAATSATTPAPTPSPASSPAPAAEISPGPQAKPDFSAGDLAFRERKDPARGREALRIYRELYDKFPGDPEAAWHLGMGAYFVGIRLTEDSDTKKQLFAEGRDAALFGTKRDANCAPCYFWAAINMALYGDTVGAVKMLFSVGEIRDLLKTSIRLDPTQVYGGAFRVLGLIDQKLPGILGGDNDRAREYFQQAIKYGPDEPLNYLFLARLLAQNFDDKKGALAIAEKGLVVPYPAAERLESRDAYEDLKKFVVDHGGVVPASAKNAGGLEQKK